MPHPDRVDDRQPAAVAVRLCREKGLPVADRPEGWTVLPATPAQVADAVSAAASAGAAVDVTYGQRSGFESSQLVINLSGLTRLVELRPEDMLAVVEAGLTVGELRRLLGSAGLVFPPARLCADDRTVGELVSRGGLRGTSTGPPRDYVLGLRIVDARGGLVRLGSRAIKNATGYSLTQLHAASCSSFGAMVELTVRLAPAQPVRRTIVSEYGSFRLALDAVNAITPPVGPAAVALAIDSPTAELTPSLSVAVGHCAVVCAVESADASLTSERANQLLMMIGETAALSVHVVDEASDGAAWDEVRVAIGRGCIDGGFLVSVSAPRDRIAALAESLARIAAATGLEARLFGETGAGSLNLVLKSREPSLSTLPDFGPFAGAIIDSGGTVVDAIGPGLNAEVLELTTLPVSTVSVLRDLRSALDPSGTLGGRSR